MFEVRSVQLLDVGQQRVGVKRTEHTRPHVVLGILVAPPVPEQLVLGRSIVVQNQVAATSAIGVPRLMSGVVVAVGVLPQGLKQELDLTLLVLRGDTRTVLSVSLRVDRLDNTGDIVCQSNQRLSRRAVERFWNISMMVAKCKEVFLISLCGYEDNPTRDGATATENRAALAPVQCVPCRETQAGTPGYPGGG